MAKANLISASEFCVYHNIEYTFISNLKEFGLVEIVQVQQTDYIPEDQLEKLERMIRLHRELEINPEGIDTIRPFAWANEPFTGGSGCAEEQAASL